MTSQPVTNASGCKGCPEPRTPPSNGGVAPEAPERRLRPSGQGWVVWTGGPSKTHLAALAHALPPNIEHIAIHPDGSIEYDTNRPGGWEPPSPIDGYVRDAVNHGLYRPVWKSCQHRYFSLKIKENCQCVDVVAKCGNPQASVVDEFIECEICDRCLERVVIPEPFVPKRKTLHSRSI